MWKKIGGLLENVSLEGFLIIKDISSEETNPKYPDRMEQIKKVLKQFNWWQSEEEYFFFVRGTKRITDDFTKDGLSVENTNVIQINYSVLWMQTGEHFLKNLSTIPGTTSCCSPRGTSRSKGSGDNQASVTWKKFRVGRRMWMGLDNSHSNCLSN